jgi:hypothetical protein
MFNYGSLSDELC